MTVGQDVFASATLNIDAAEQLFSTPSIGRYRVKALKIVLTGGGGLIELLAGPGGTSFFKQYCAVNTTVDVDADFFGGEGMPVPGTQGTGAMAIYVKRLIGCTGCNISMRAIEG